MSQPTITNALGPMGSFGPKLLESLAVKDGVSFDEILDWDPVPTIKVDGDKTDEVAGAARSKLEAAREAKAKKRTTG